MRLGGDVFERCVPDKYSDIATKWVPSVSGMLTIVVLSSCLSLWEDVERRHGSTIVKRRDLIGFCASFASQQLELLVARRWAVPAIAGGMDWPSIAVRIAHPPPPPLPIPLQVSWWDTGRCQHYNLRPHWIIPSNYQKAPILHRSVFFAS